MTKPWRTALIAVACLAAPFALAIMVNALYWMCIGFGWEPNGAGPFAGFAGVIAVAVAVAVIFSQRDHR